MKKREVSVGMIIFWVLLVLIVGTFTVALTGSLIETYIQFGGDAVMDRVRNGFGALKSLIGFFLVVSFPFAVFFATSWD